MSDVQQSETHYARYYRANREKYRAKWKEYYAANRDKLLEQKRKRRSDGAFAEREKAYRLLSYKRDRAKLMFRNARNRAKERGIEFDLTYADVVIPPLCPVFGVPFELDFETGRMSRYAPSLDRIDNTKGYVRGNIIVVSLRANQIKNDATVDEIQATADFYRRLAQAGGPSVP